MIKKYELVRLPAYLEECTRQSQMSREKLDAVDRIDTTAVFLVSVLNAMPGLYKTLAERHWRAVAAILMDEGVLIADKEEDRRYLVRHAPLQAHITLTITAVIMESLEIIPKQNHGEFEAVSPAS